MLIFGDVEGADEVAALQSNLGDQAAGFSFAENEKFHQNLEKQLLAASF